jgi:hypothetical protein
MFMHDAIEDDQREAADDFYADLYGPEEKDPNKTSWLVYRCFNCPHEGIEKKTLIGECWSEEAADQLAEDEAPYYSPKIFWFEIV